MKLSAGSRLLFGASLAQWTVGLSFVVGNAAALGWTMRGFARDIQDVKGDTGRLAAGYDALTIKVNDIGLDVAAIKTELRIRGGGRVSSDDQRASGHR